MAAVVTFKTNIFEVELPVSVNDLEPILYLAREEAVRRLIDPATLVVKTDSKGIVIGADAEKEEQP